jgi:hypothetical protein
VSSKAGTGVTAQKAITDVSNARGGKPCAPKLR